MEAEERVSMLVSTLTLDGFESLPAHDRRCTFWTTDEGDAIAPPEIADPEFEKEAWLSMVMLEWGPCGQVAAASGTPVGCALYAPPGAVPRAATFPTSPVSPDAVLLTSLSIADDGDSGSGHSGDDDLRTVLLQAVVRDLVNRGVRAVETFGYRAGADEPVLHEVDTPAATRAARNLCSPARCMTDADFLEKYGFDVIGPHHRFPRLRLELDRDHGWKEDVESALERLVFAAAITMEESGARVPVGVH